MIQNSLEFDWFKAEKQFQAGHGVITTPFEKIHFSVKNPYELVDYNPIGIFPGFTDGISGTDRLSNAYAESGKLAFSLNFPRTMNPDFEGDPEGHKVNSGMLVIDALRTIVPDLQQIDGEGHSEGGANLTRACLEHPEEFRSALVIASGGLIKGDTQAKIMGRALLNPHIFVRMTGQMLSHPSYTLDIARNSVNYVWQNPKKARQEAARIASADIRSRFPVLSHRGIPNGALQFIGDELFPLHLVLDSTANGSIFDLFTVYPFPDADHITPQKHPRTVASIALAMTAKLLEIQAARVSSEQSGQLHWPIAGN
jgi:hypothetical protein